MWGQSAHQSVIVLTTDSRANGRVWAPEFLGPGWTLPMEQSQRVLQRDKTGSDGVPWPDGTAGPSWSTQPEEDLENVKKDAQKHGMLPRRRQGKGPCLPLFLLSGCQEKIACVRIIFMADAPNCFAWIPTAMFRIFSWTLCAALPFTNPDESSLEHPSWGLQALLIAAVGPDSSTACSSWVCWGRVSPSHLATSLFSSPMLHFTF